MASIRDIKRRKNSIENTAAMTRAMQMVATVRFGRARERAEKAMPYFGKMYETMQDILSRCQNVRHPYLVGGATGKKAVIVITSNRGLAGGYHLDMIRKVTDSGILPEKAQLYTLGSKGRDGLKSLGFLVVRDYSEYAEDATFDVARKVGEDVLAAFKNGEVGEIYLAYTHFKNTVIHIPRWLRLLPAEPLAGEMDGSSGETDVFGADIDSSGLPPMNFEPSADSVLDEIIPLYINSMIYGGWLEASASENGARMTAMDNATGNAQDMIDQLELAYNRARHGAITQEITEIVSGSEALGE